ncbi:MAG TPA: UvrD-helicase domain-containing protein [Burkholderiales bacterium]
MSSAARSAIADASVRERALAHTDSFIVQAPAGSGKTELLVQRYLKLLYLAKNPEEVLAITFTRKAAAEMRKRVLKELPNPGEIAHRLRILTMDAFCASLTRQVPVLARFGAQPETVEDASGLYLDAAFRTLGDFRDPNVARILAHLDNDLAAAAGLLAALLARRDQWLRNAGNPPTRAELEAVLLSERERLLGHARKIDPRSSEEFAKAVLTLKGEWRKKPRPAPADIVGNEPLRKALISLLKLPPGKYGEAQWEALEAILALLIPAVKQLVAAFSEKNRVDFTQISHGALTALGSADDPSELLLSLDARISHILVDEFQDTSVPQWALLERLTAGWEEGDGRTVFLVGDPMQSIYRFREAEVGLFLRAWHEGLGGIALEPLTLTTNFRSQAGVVNWVNAFFPSVLPAHADEASGAVPYSPSTLHKPAEPGPAVEWHCFFERAAEAEKTVQLIKAAKGSAAVLVRNRTALAEIVPALKAAGVRYRAVEIETLGEKQVVQDLYALTRALLHPADRVAWLAILRAPWIGLDLSALSFLFESKRDQTIWELIQEAPFRDFPSLTRLRKVLSPAIADRMRGSLRARVEGVWLALGGPACVQGETDLEDAGIFLDELEKLEEAGGLPDLAVLADKLEKLWALPDVEAGPGAVEIMTVHKAKGLEWDTVIVPGLDRAPRSGERKLFDFKSLAENRLLLAPINEAGSDGDPLYEYVRNLNKEAEDIEAGRLFYVAATRARSRLHLLACAKPGEAGGPKAPSKRSLLYKAWFEAEHQFPASIPDANTVVVEPAPPPQFLQRLPAGYGVPPAPPAVAWEALPEGRDQEERPDFDWAKEPARLAGIVVHAWFQRIAEDELRGWDAKRVDSLRPRFLRDLERRGVVPAEMDRAAGLVVTALKNAISDERGRWLLGPHPMARNEYRVCTPTRKLRIDRYFRDESGKHWVVDYKTGEHRGDAEKYLDEQQQRYASQLDAYSDVLQGARRGLYFPLLKGWREW